MSSILSHVSQVDIMTTSSHLYPAGGRYKEGPGLPEMPEHLHLFLYKAQRGRGAEGEGGVLGRV